MFHPRKSVKLLSQAFMTVQVHLPGKEYEVISHLFFSNFVGLVVQQPKEMLLIDCTPLVPVFTIVFFLAKGDSPYILLH